MAVVKKSRPSKKKASKKAPKKVTKKVEKKPEIKAQVDEPKKNLDTLDSSHLLQLETISRDVENAKLLMSIEEQSLRNMVLSLEILEAKIDKQKEVVNDRSKRHLLMQSRMTSVQKDIWGIYGLKENEGLGYNPKTGEIVRNV